jgi:hypothetical protein
VVSELGIFAYCAAMGFVAAATIASFYQWVTSQRADFVIARQSPAAMALAVLISMFGGPFIVVQKVWAGLRSHELRVVPALLGVLVAGMWSVCAGIFYVSLLIST